MRVRPAACAAVILVVVGCGSDDRRDAVREYIEHVNRVSGELGAPLIEVQNAYSRFSTRGEDLRALRPKLERSKRTILTLQSRLRKVAAPPEARPLRRRLLLLVGAEAALAREVVQFVVFVPRLEATLRPLGPATARLRLVLRRSGDTQAQATTLTAYSRTVAAAVRRLRRFDPPPALRPSYTADVAALTRVSTLARRLSNALTDSRQEVLSRTVADFNRAARTGGTVSAQRAERRAIVAYNRRVGRIDTLAAAAQLERLRLERRLQ